MSEKSENIIYILCAGIIALLCNTGSNFSQMGESSWVVASLAVLLSGISRKYVHWELLCETHICILCLCLEAKSLVTSGALSLCQRFCYPVTVFLNRWAVARYRALASIIPGRKTPEETTICHKISLVQLITNLNVMLYLSTCHTVYISVLILFMIMP